MNTNMKRLPIPILLAGAAIVASLLILSGDPTLAQTPAPAGSGFTYQGYLTDGAGQPVNGSCVITATLWDAASGGSQVGPDVITTITATNGYFSTLLDFGTSPWDGSARWLQIASECPAGEDAETFGRQSVNPVPYALHVSAPLTLSSISPQLSLINPIGPAGMTVSVSATTGIVTLNASGTAPGIVFPDNVGVGLSSLSNQLEVSNLGTATLGVRSYNSTATTAGRFVFYKSHSNIEANIETESGDYLGQIQFQGVDTGTNLDRGATIYAVQVGSAGTRIPTELVFLVSSGIALIDRAFVINSAGGSVFNDTGLGSAVFRVEGDTDVNLIYSDASNDRLGVGTAAPAAKLQVNGNIWPVTITQNLGSSSLWWNEINYHTLSSHSLGIVDDNVISGTATISCTDVISILRKSSIVMDNGLRHVDVASLPPFLVRPAIDSVATRSFTDTRVLTGTYVSVETVYDDAGLLQWYSYSYTETLRGDPAIDMDAFTSVLMCAMKQLYKKGLALDRRQDELEQQGQALTQRVARLESLVCQKWPTTPGCQ